MQCNSRCGGKCQNTSLNGEQHRYDREYRRSEYPDASPKGNRNFFRELSTRQTHLFLENVSQVRNHVGNGVLQVRLLIHCSCPQDCAPAGWEVTTRNYRWHSLTSGTGRTRRAPPLQNLTPA